MKIEEMRWRVQVTEEQSNAIQEALFAKGGCWRDTGKNIDTHRGPCLYYGGSLTWGCVYHNFLRDELPLLHPHEVLEMIEACDGPEEEKPKTRPMTRLEVLEFVAKTAGIVVRHGDRSPRPAQYYEYPRDTEAYKWAYINNGEIGEWHAFEVEV